MFSIIFPFFNTIILSEIDLTTGKLCEIKIKEKSKLFFRSVSKFKIENLVELSSAETHSSQIKILGLSDIAAAITTPVSYTHLTLPPICSV